MLTLGCGTKQDYQLPTSERNGELSGEVFIVTQAGPSIKLGLVTVVAIPEADMTRYLESKKVDADKWTQAREQEIHTLESNVAEYRQAIAAGEAQINTLVRAEKDAFARYMEVTKQGTLRTMEHPEIGKKEADESDLCLEKIREMREAVAKNRKDLAWSQSKITEIRERQNWATSRSFYLDALPAGTARTKTNADGLFSMSLPTHGRYALAASTHREILGKTEYLDWLLWVTLDGAESKRIMLSNDNLVTSESPESVISLAP